MRGHRPGRGPRLYHGVQALPPSAHGPEAAADRQGDIPSFPIHLCQEQHRTRDVATPVSHSRIHAIVSSAPGLPHWTALTNAPGVAPIPPSLASSVAACRRSDARAEGLRRHGGKGREGAQAWRSQRSWRAVASRRLMGSCLVCLSVRLLYIFTRCDKRDDEYNNRVVPQ